LTAVKLVAGEYHEGQLSDAMNKSPLVADLVQTWMEKGEDRPTLCFCVDRAHAKAVQLKFMAAGISCGYIDCFSGRAEREEVRLAFASGDLRVVCNVGVLTTGVDWDVRCIILARPTRSRILFTQIIGRGLRRAEGKDHCLVLDHSDNHLRLGFVTDPIPQELDDGEGPRRDERQHGEPLPSECASCHFLRPPKVHKCPACGFEPKPVSTIKCDDGELVEIKRLERERIDETERAQWHGALARIASLRGYKPGWAAHKFKEKFGHFPACRYPEECAPTQEIYNWVRSRQIAWAKSRPPDG
jgi:superfamily II DNA or RNA helicase